MRHLGIRSTVFVLALVVIFAGVAGWASYRIGMASGKISTLSQSTFGKFRQPFSELPFHRRLNHSVDEAFLADYTTDGQDMWVTRVVFPDVEDGYYVDVGSADGVSQSNTKILDDNGWEGICIDPFPTGMETRTAKVFTEVVDSEGGREIEFRGSGFIGGIDEYIDHTKDWNEQKAASVTVLTTTTLDDILERADAPQYIHYMSLDIEGAELEALKGLSFSKYKVGSLTIEHNWEEPKRTQIRSLLESKGYRRVLSRFRDDYYVHRDLTPCFSISFLKQGCIGDE